MIEYFKSVTRESAYIAGLIALVLLIPTALAIGSAERHLAKAEPPPPPSRLEAVDLAKLDAANTHMKLVMQEAAAAIAPHAAEVQRICDAYKIDRQQLEQGIVAIDSKTGEIRRQKPTEKAPPAPAVKK